MNDMAVGPYFVALAALTATPGPLMAVLVARTLRHDSKGANAFAAGLCAGDVLAVCVVALGIGVWFEGRPELLLLAKYLGVAYLLWLSVKVWNDRTPITSAQPREGGWLASAGAGMAICLGNPSTLLMYILLLPRIAPRGIASVEQMALLVIVTFAAVGTVFFGTILMARQLHRIIIVSSALNRITAAMIALTSLWILAA